MASNTPTITPASEIVRMLQSPREEYISFIEENIVKIFKSLMSQEIRVWFLKYNSLSMNTNIDGFTSVNCIQQTPPKGLTLNIMSEILTKFEYITDFKTKSVLSVRLPTCDEVSPSIKNPPPTGDEVYPPVKTQSQTPPRPSDMRRLYEVIESKRDGFIREELMKYSLSPTEVWCLLNHILDHSSVLSAVEYLTMLYPLSLREIEYFLEKELDTRIVEFLKKCKESITSAVVRQKLSRYISTFDKLAKFKRLYNTHSAIITSDDFTGFLNDTIKVGNVLVAKFLNSSRSLHKGEVERCIYLATNLQKPNMIEFFNDLMKKFIAPKKPNLTVPEFKKLLERITTFELVKFEEMYNKYAVTDVEFWCFMDVAVKVGNVQAAQFLNSKRPLRISDIERYISLATLSQNAISIEFFTNLMVEQHGYKF